jgi:hypothetical protein
VLASPYRIAAIPNNCTDRNTHYQYQGIEQIDWSQFDLVLVSETYWASQTQILEKGVYLVEQLQKKHEVMNQLKAIIFVQPTEVNINYI